MKSFIDRLKGLSNPLPPPAPTPEVTERPRRRQAPPRPRPGRSAPTADILADGNGVPTSAEPGYWPGGSWPVGVYTRSKEESGRILASALEAEGVSGPLADFFFAFARKESGTRVSLPGRPWYKVTAFGLFQFNLGAYRRDLGDSRPLTALIEDEANNPVEHTRRIIRFYLELTRGLTPWHAAATILIRHAGPQYLADWQRGWKVRLTSTSSRASTRDYHPQLVRLAEARASLYTGDLRGRTVEQLRAAAKKAKAEYSRLVEFHEE